MAVGEQGTVTGLNSQLTTMAINLRNNCVQIREFNEYITTLGSTGLQALGFTSADATSFINDLNFMGNVAGVYFGTATQATASNYDSALSGLWEGQ